MVHAHRRHVEREERRREPEPPRAAPPETAVLALQRSAGNAAVAQMLQRYAQIPPAEQTPGEWPADWLVRVSDDGTMAVRQDDLAGSRVLWATPDRIDASNSALAKKGSSIRLRQGSGTLAGTAPAYDTLGIPQRTYLVSAEPEDTSSAAPRTTLDLWADCAKSAREVMGVGGADAAADKVRATWVQRGKTVETSSSDARDMADEIIQAELGGMLTNGWDVYAGLTPEERDRFDAAHGINKYVNPNVGEAFAMRSDDVRNLLQFTWSFHWAGVVLSNGAEHVTLENFGIKNEPETRNQEWTFQLYGTPWAGQTFHEDHKADQEHGRDPTTMHGSPR